MNWSYEKLVFGLALVAAGLSVAWSWRQLGSIRNLRAGETTLVLSDERYVAATWRPPEPSGVLWVAPPPQSKGGDWRYEVFTPPEIFHDTAAGAFAVRPSGRFAEPVDPAAEMEPLALPPAPYRLQLLGYIGEPGDYLAVLVDPHSPETLLARPGHRWAELGLTLKYFDVRKVATEAGEFGPTYEVAAIAVLQDEATGAEVVLDSRPRKFPDASPTVPMARGRAVPSTPPIPPSAPAVVPDEQALPSP